MNTSIEIHANLPELAEGVTREIGEVAMQVALSIESESKRLIQQSQPTGRTYRRGAITHSFSQKLLALGYRASKSRPGRIVTGYRFHRASARGEPPANDTSNLVNSIKAKRAGKIGAEVDVNAGYSWFLENPEMLDRPFLIPAIDFTLEHVLPTL